MDECQRASCGHAVSDHEDTDEGANLGACTVEGCDCSALVAAADDEPVDDAPAAPDSDAAAEAVSLTFSAEALELLAQIPAERRAEMIKRLAREASAHISEMLSAFKPLPAGACYRTGCTHMGAAHIDLPDAPGAGKCSADGCTCHGFMPEGAPGEPALPEPAVAAGGERAAAAVEDGAPGEPGAEPVEPVDGADPAEEEGPGDGFPFFALLVQEGVETIDGRFIEPLATTWRPTPLSLAYQDKTPHGGMSDDTAAINIGRIDEIQRVPGAAEGTYDIIAVGVIDDDDPVAVMAAHKIEGRFIQGVSVDLAIHEASIEITAVDDEGWPIGERLIVSSAEIGMATVTPFPAFGDCQIELTGPGPSDIEAEAGIDLPGVGDRIPVLAAGEIPESFTYHFAEPAYVEERAAMTVLASGGPIAPPAAWFEQPAFTEEELVQIPPHLCAGKRGVRACPLTITDEGRVYGHLASWDVLHTAMNGRQIRAPRGGDYALWHSRGVVRTAEGHDVGVGSITLDGGHASLQLDWRAAMAHYDDTRSAVIDARVGEDQYGIWIAGALRPDVDELTLRRLRAASISGDWRPLGGRNELVAACSCNVPGFPTMRAAIAASAGEGLGALVAAGALPTRLEEEPVGLLRRAVDELAAARREREADRLLRTIG